MDLIGYMIAVGVFGGTLYAGAWVGFKKRGLGRLVFSVAMHAAAIGVMTLFI